MAGREHDISILEQIAADLHRLATQATAIEEPLLAYLLDMARDGVADLLKREAEEPAVNESRPRAPGVKAEKKAPEYGSG